MLAIRLAENIENRLSNLARETGRTKTFYAREAILNYLDDLEDLYLAKSRLAHPADTVSLDDLLKDEADVDGRI